MKIIWHKHHIIPRHMGGDNNSDNIIKVNIPLHAFLHKLLWEEHGHWQDELAWLALSGHITKSEAKQMAIENGISNSAKVRSGVPLTEQHKLKLSTVKRKQYKKRKPMPPRTAEVKAKIKMTMTGQKHPPERVEANRLGQLKRFGIT